MAISAVDNALWDLKAKLLGVPLVRLLGRVRESVPAYGSGGFTSCDAARLRSQLGGWAREGFAMVKMKVGRNPDDDAARVREARSAIGDAAQLFVDANGAYARKQALVLAAAFADCGVGWFEEPVSSDDLAGLHLLRDRTPAGMDIAAGEYGYDSCYFRRMLEAGAVDVLQADATRCGGITGYLRAAALCEAFNVPLSAHGAPGLHCTSRAPRAHRATSSASTTAYASSICCSTACPSRPVGSCVPTLPGPVRVFPSSTQTRNGMPCDGHARICSGRGSRCAKCRDGRERRRP